MRKTIIAAFIGMMLLSLQPPEYGHSQSTVTPIDSKNDLIKKMRDTVDAKMDSAKQKLKVAAKYCKSPVIYKTRVKVVYVHDTLYVPITDSAGYRTVKKKNLFQRIFH